MQSPPRGFPVTEFEQRTERAQALMAKAGIDILLVCTEPEVRYFTGFLTPFWQSPTRPWFTVVPSSETRCRDTEHRTRVHVRYVAR